MNIKVVFEKRRYGIRECERYLCQVAECGIDCGDQGTLERHIKREHSEQLDLSEDTGIPDSQQRQRMQNEPADGLCSS